MGMIQSTVMHRLVFCALAVVWSALAVGQTPTPDQLRQLQRLSPSEQSALAARFGITLPAPASLGASAGGQDLQTEIRQDDLFPTGGDPRDGSATTTESSTGKAPDDRFKNLKPYGYSLFQSKPSTFSPAGALPVPESYTIAPGDRLRVILFGKESGDFVIATGRDGTVAIPDIGRISIQGLSFEAARDLITRQITERKLGVSVAVTLDEMRSIQVFVLGDVTQPGSFAVSPFSTVLNALFTAGGITERGSLRNIELKRAGRTIARLDLYDLLLQGDISGDQRIESGDVVYVPSVGQQIAVSGEVKRPGIFEIVEGENLADVITFASGFSGFAYENQIRLLRTERGEARAPRTLVSADLSGIPPQSGDLLEILSVSSRPIRSVELVGLAERPGIVEWRESLRLRDLLPDASAFTLSPAESLIIVEEYVGPERALEINVVSGALIFSDAAGAHPLSVDARVTIIPATTYEKFDRETFFNQLIATIERGTAFGDVPNTVRVQGEVRNPGLYPMPKSQSVNDVVALAGGLTYEADRDSLELVSPSVDGFVVQRIAESQFGVETIVRAGAELFVRQDSNAVALPVVEVVGRVRFPGIYRMPDGATMRDLVDRAGGFLEDADLGAAIFSRQALRDKETIRLAEIQQETEEELAQQALTNRSLLENQDADSVRASQELGQLLRQIQTTEPVGRLVIDLPAAVAGRVTQNIRLENGDRLLIPRIQQSVSVFGEVLYPTSHVYQVGLSPTDYIQRSGGMNNRADSSKTYIIRVNGAVDPVGRQGVLTRRFRNEVAIEPGDTIVIPRDVDDIPTLQLWTSVTQIIYQSAIAIAAIGVL